MTAAEQEAELARLTGAKRVGREWRARCPCHEDANPSLDFRAEGARVLFTCRAGCPSGAVFEAFKAKHPEVFNGNGRARESMRWEIKDALGKVIAAHTRIDKPGGGKDMPWSLPDGSKGLGGKSTRDLPLYGLPELLAAKTAAEGDAPPIVILTEGEKDADGARRLGFVAVGTVTGAASVPCDTSLKPLVGCHVLLWPDNDSGGRRHMRSIRARLVALGAQADDVLTIDWPDAPPKGGACDFKGTRDDLLRLVKAGEAIAPSDTTKPSETVEDLTRFMARLSGAPELGWLIAGLLPDEGNALWHGQPRDFKSFAALEAMLALATGRAPFEHERFHVARATRVCLFTEEDSERLFYARVRWLTERKGAPEPGMFFPVIRKALTFDSPTTQEEIIERIRTCGAEVAAFDPLRSFTAQSDKGPADFAPVARFTRRIQNETQCKSILIVHHDVKPLATSNGNPDRSRSQQASGGGVFSVSDCPVSFKKLSWNRVGVFPEDYKLSGDPKPFEIEFQTDERYNENGAPCFGTWVRPVATTKDERDVGADVERERIMACLEDFGKKAAEAKRWASVGELEKAAKIQHGGASRILDELEIAGVVRKAEKEEAKRLGRSKNAQLWILSRVSPGSLPERLAQGSQVSPPSCKEGRDGETLVRSRKKKAGGAVSPGETCTEGAKC